MRKGRVYANNGRTPLPDAAEIGYLKFDFDFK